jgi:hypothetical protein
MNMIILQQQYKYKLDYIVLLLFSRKMCITCFCKHVLTQKIGKCALKKLAKCIKKIGVMCINFFLIYVHSNFKKNMFCINSKKLIIVHQAYPDKNLLSENPGEL